MSDDPFRDVPLFREIQRLLASNQGPVNYEIARQIARSVAGDAGSAGAVSETAAYRLAVRSAEDVIAGFTQLAPIEPMQFRLINRIEWLEATFGDWRWLLDRFGERFAGAPPMPSAEGGADPLQAAVQQIGPLLLGVQTGTVLGHIARGVLSHYDAPIPRERTDLLFVVPNINELASGYELDAGFRDWFAMREVAHHVVASSTPWVTNYWRSLLTEIIDALEIDLADLERRFTELQAGGLGDFEQGLPTDALLPVAPSARHSAALERARAFTALLRGYAAHALDAVASTTMGDRSERYTEALSRYQSDHEQDLAFLRDSLGLLPETTLDAPGRTFCAAVARLHGMHVLNRVWSAPDNLPTIDEIRDPFVWIERVASDPAS